MDFGVKKNTRPLRPPQFAPDARHQPPCAAHCKPDFQFVYAFLRAESNDMATFAPVIWGGVNPNPENEDLGTGITLWDFEANYAFAQTYDAEGLATKQYPRGRFLAVYERKLSDQTDDPVDATVTWVAAVLRNFVPKENYPADPAVYSGDLDYLYGKYQGAFTLGFVDFGLTADIFPGGANADQVAETLATRAAYVGTGVGRGELTLSGGSLDTAYPGHFAAGTECWDTNLDRSYYVLVDGANPVCEARPIAAECTPIEAEEGTVAGCGIFVAGLPDWLPSRDVELCMDPACVSGCAGDQTCVDACEHVNECPADLLTALGTVGDNGL